MIFYHQPYIKTLMSIKETKRNVRRVNFLLDLQNMAIGSYVVDYSMLERDLKTYAWYNFLALLQQLVSTIREGEKSQLDVHFYLYFDVERNLFNEKLISTWKEPRRKVMFDILEKQPDSWCSLRLASRVAKSVYEMFYRFSKYSSKIHTIKLKYIDSDFIPGLFLLLDNKKDTLYVVVSSDNDYLHLTNEENFVMLHTVRKMRTDKHLDNMIAAGVEQIDYYLKERFQINTVEEAGLFRRFFTIMHALAGDIGDGILPLRRGYGPKRILKGLSGLLRTYNDRWSFYQDLLSNSENILTALQTMYKVGKDEADKLLEELKKRLIITDHMILGALVLKGVDSLKVTDPRYEIGVQFGELLTYEQTNVLKMASQSIYNDLLVKRRLDSYKEVQALTNWLQNLAKQLFSGDQEMEVDMSFLDRLFYVRHSFSVS